jgi:hypothetical protein
MAYGVYFEWLFGIGSQLTVWGFLERSLSLFDLWTGGTFVGLCALVVIAGIYQKTNSVVAVYTLAVVTLGVIRNTYFFELSVLFFYVIVLAITATVFGLIRGRE